MINMSEETSSSFGDSEHVHDMSSKHLSEMIAYICNHVQNFPLFG